MEEEALYPGCPPHTSSPQGPPDLRQEDEILCELDVFMSPKLSDHTYILQYPLRTSWRPYDPTELRTVRFKDGLKESGKGDAAVTKLEVEYKHSEVFLSKHCDSTQQRRHFMLSSTPVREPTNLAVGVFRGNQLHLTPVRQVLQLRPSFAHIAAKSSAQEDPVVGKGGGKALESKPEDARPKAYDEPWISLKYKNLALCGDEDEIFDNLFAQDFVPIEFDTPADTYLNQVAPTRPPRAALDARMVPGMCLSDIRKLHALKNKLVALFLNAHVLLLEEICGALQLKDREDDVVRALEQVAYFVSERWVVKSEFGHKGEKTLAVRDYLLYLLHENKYVHRREFAHLTNISYKTAHQLLLEVAEREAYVADGRKVVGWRLKKLPDAYFKLKYPAVVTRQEALTAARGQRLLQKFSQTTHESLDGDSGVSDVTSTPETTAPAEGIPGIELMHRELAENFKRFLTSLFLEHPVCNIPYLKQLMAQNQKIYPYLASVPENVFRAVLNHIANSLHSVYFLKSVDPAIDKYRNVVVDLFRNKMCVKKKEVLDAFQQILEEKVKDNIYTRVIKEFAEAKGNQWIFKTGNG